MDFVPHQEAFLQSVSLQLPPVLSEVQTDIFVSNLEQVLGIEETLNPPYDKGVDQFNNDAAMNQRKGATNQIARAVVTAVGETRKFVMDPVDFALSESSRKKHSSHHTEHPLTLGDALQRAVLLKKIPKCGPAYKAYLLYVVNLVDKLGKNPEDEAPSAATMHLLESLAHAR